MMKTASARIDEQTECLVVSVNSPKLPFIRNEN